MAEHDEKYAGYDRITASDEDERHLNTGYREFVYPLDHARVRDFRGMGAREYASFRFEAVEMLRHAVQAWEATLAEPFRGVTSDGEVRGGLYRAAPVLPGEEAPTRSMVAAATAALSLLDPDERENLQYPVDSVQWRAWSNPEVMIFDNGLRLEDLRPDVRDALLRIVEASLGGDGYTLVRTLMRLNGFLGELTDLPMVMNEYSYHFSLFGVPSEDGPWGWQLFGHHVAVNVFVFGDRMVISPVFLGAEPTFADAGPLAGYTAFSRRHALALELVSLLDETQLARARIYDTMRSPKMPPGRLHPLDERHLGGAFQDNAVIPYEGVRVTELSPDARQRVLDILDDCFALLPDGPRRGRLREVGDYLDETWLTWIGGTERSTPFYFRIQSPVVLAEFDHHSGVWLSNETPGTFHTHTVLRTPNGNDYGYALRDIPAS